MTDRKPRELPKADTIIFLETAEVLSISHSKLCEMLGFATNTHHNWIATGKMPKVVEIACASLRAKRPESVDKIWIVRPRDKSTTLAAVLKAMNIPFTELSL